MSTDLHRNNSHAEKRYPVDEKLENPIVSVIIPTYNRASFIRETLESVLAQTYQNLDIIVVDDGSTDNTATVLADFKNQIRFFQLDQNRGGPHARNLGFRESVGDYIQFLDSDDLLDSRKIEIQMGFIVGSTDHIAYCPWARFTSDEQGHRKFFTLQQQHGLGTHEDILRKMLRGWFCPPHAYIFSRKLLEKINDGNPWDERLWQNQDIDLLYQLVFQNPKFVFCPGALVYYRKNTHSVAGEYSERTLNSRILVLEKITDRISRSSIIERYQEAIADAWLNLARDSYRVNKSRSITLAKIARNFYPDVKPRGKFLYRMIYRLNGFETAQNAWAFKELILSKIQSLRKFSRSTTG